MRDHERISFTLFATKRRMDLCLAEASAIKWPELAAIFK